MKKTSKKETLIHGTSTKYLREILKQGLIPNPKQKQFEQKSGVIGKFQGVYLGKNAKKAQSYAENAVKNRGGLPMFVVAQIETKTPSVSIDEETLFIILRDEIISFDEDVNISPQMMLTIIEEKFSLKVPSSKEGTFILSLVENATSLFWGSFNDKKQATEFKNVLKELAKQLSFFKQTVLEKGWGVVSQEPITFKGSNKILNILCFIELRVEELRKLNTDKSKFPQEIVSFLNKKAGFTVVRNWKETVLDWALMPPLGIVFAIPLYEKNKSLSLKIISELYEEPANVLVYLSPQGEITS